MDAGLAGGPAEERLPHRTGLVVAHPRGKHPQVHGVVRAEADLLAPALLVEMG